MVQVFSDFQLDIIFQELSRSHRFEFIQPEIDFGENSRCEKPLGKEIVHDIVRSYCPGKFRPALGTNLTPALVAGDKKRRCYGGCGRYCICPEKLLDIAVAGGFSV
jgi:hypothetical protein